MSFMSLYEFVEATREKMAEKKYYCQKIYLRSRKLIKTHKTHTAKTGKLTLCDLQGDGFLALYEAGRMTREPKDIT